MHPKLEEAVAIRQKYLLAVRGALGEVDLMTAVIDREVERVDKLAHSCTNSALADALIGWAAAQISLAALGLSSALRVRQPATPNDLASAFELLREVATTTLEGFDKATEALLWTAQKNADVHLARTGSELKSLLESEAIVAAPVLPHLQPLADLAARSRSEAITLADFNRSMANLFPDLLAAETRRLRAGMEADLRAVDLRSLERVQLKYRRISAALRTAPPVAGYITDAILKAHGLPGFATELGIIAAAVEEWILAERIEKAQDQEGELDTAEAAIWLGLVAIPGAALAKTRVSFLQDAYLKSVMGDLDESTG